MVQAGIVGDVSDIRSGSGVRSAPEGELFVDEVPTRLSKKKSRNLRRTVTIQTVGNERTTVTGGRVTSAGARPGTARARLIERTNRQSLNRVTAKTSSASTARQPIPGSDFQPGQIQFPELPDRPDRQLRRVGIILGVFVLVVVAIAQFSKGFGRGVGS